MNEKELTTLLKNLKDSPEFGGWVDRHELNAGWKPIARELGFEQEPQAWAYTLRDYVDYVLHGVFLQTLRPVAVSLAAFAIMFGGWVTTVNASFDSLPGDILYSVKIASERMQLSFASSTSQRARLHAEFAGRRLQEVVEISNSDRSDKDGLVQVAVDGFKAELASANQQLSQVQDAEPSVAASIAEVIDRKTDEYEAVLAQSESGMTEVGKVAVEDALNAVSASNDQAIDSLVQSHESTQEEATAEQLQQNFQQEYTGLKTRIALNLGRLSVISSVLERVTGDTSDFETSIEQARDAVSGNEAVMNDAMDLLAAGGYRGAFSALKSVDEHISASEDIITGLEIELSTMIAAQAPVEPANEPAVTVPDPEPPTF